MPRYRVDFLPSALKEWGKLSPDVVEQFRAKLFERLDDPHNPASRLRGMPNCYKIKLRAVGYRLVYRVDDNEIVVLVISVGRRDKDSVYKAALARLA